MNRYPDYRGQEYIELAKELAQNGSINPKILGLLKSPYFFSWLVAPKP
ncbi:hypothetical protein VCRA2123O444_140045 [Vibrio crassostreae]|nr:hypothetical protein VCRA2113O411_100024 [Vibrio crassostreae]CAK1693796.1 hypothetical protein VCRA2118O429_100024 [Vibrio crassostreae]CAK1694120.1 hypothetical protein VCRA2113O412_100024 [Vibrio crassostreae]CAK1694190.1 hypothetical protein VCRA2114O421_100025 [Vibrio crassostreae]CAK1708408.1 hypothetical protein VCRA2113O414_100158 [Vibrio crassostreae]